MNFYTKLLTLFVVAAFALGACKSTPKFSDVMGKEWRLVEVKTEPKNIQFDRNNLKSEGFENIFTLNFAAERLNGAAAPNLYFAPYALEKKQVIKVQPLGGTLMAPIHEPEKLKERDFFGYMQNAYKWNLANGKLELYTKGENETETVLIFSL